MHDILIGHGTLAHGTIALSDILAILSLALSVLQTAVAILAAMFAYQALK